MAKSGNKKELVAELLRIQKKLNKTPTIEDIKKHSKYPLGDYTAKFTNFTAAKQEAFKKAKKSKKKKDIADLLLGDLTRLFDELGHLPTRRDVRNYGKYPSSEYENIFGTFAAA